MAARGRWATTAPRAVSEVRTGSVVVGSFTDDASRAMAANPRYFTWWYTVKSIALVGAIGTAAYFAGRSHR